MSYIEDYIKTLDSFSKSLSKNENLKAMALWEKEHLHNYFNFATAKALSEELKGLKEEITLLRKDTEETNILLKEFLQKAIKEKSLKSIKPFKPFVHKT